MVWGVVGGVGVVRKGGGGRRGWGGGLGLGMVSVMRMAALGVVVLGWMGQAMGEDYLRFRDRVEQVESGAGFGRGTVKGAAVVGDTVVLAGAVRVEGASTQGASGVVGVGGATEKIDTSYPRIGVWTGAEEMTAFGFTELLATFNVLTPGRTGAVLEYRVRMEGVDGATGGDGGGWSPWMYVQSWGKTLTPVGRVNEFEGGKVEVDILELKRAAKGYQVRVTLQSFEHDAAVTPVLRRVSVCYSGEKGADTGTEAARETLGAGVEWARDLKVPFRPQGAASVPRALWSQICSPTSMTMVMAYYGVDLPTLENAEAIYDPHYDMFGNWGRAVSRAGEQGLDSYLVRIRSLEDAKRYIAEGVPLIASIRFKKGEVEGFLYPQTAGHLIVIRGFTPEGDAIVNDPASREKGDGVVYKAAELEKAWFRPGGVAYVVRKGGK